MQASQWWGSALLRALATHIKVNRNVLITLRRNCGIVHFSQMANRDTGAARIRRVDAKGVSDIADSSSDQLGRDDADYYFAADDGLETQPSTFEDEEKVKRLLKEILAYRDTNVSNWIVESKVKHLCAAYKYLLKPHRDGFLKVLACDYAVDHSMVNRAAKLLVGLELGEQPDQRQVMKGEERLKQLLTPQYSWLFIHMGRMEHGIKFMVDLRTDVLTLISETTATDAALLPLQQLNNTLREMLSLWFSVGFLNLERITWRSSCEMLQKISEYEAVHPVRSWTDLKRRVGPYRRCFVYTHSSMPYEPLVVLHTALSDEIARSIRGIVSAASRMSVDAAAGHKILDSQAEDPSVIKAAIFYSITSTQKGLQGIELGNYLIKRVVRELQAELPLVNKFSSLSPIPNFRVWLVEKLKSADKAEPDMFTKEELERLKSHLKEEDIPGALRRVFKTNSWVNDPPLISMLEGVLMRLCARYLYLEKRRGFALDSVANFHLRNGAMMWRLNWQADLSPRGLGNSCGIMVNYRYFLEDTESNSRMYLERQHIAASEQVQKLATGARELMDKVTSKM